MSLAKQYNREFKQQLGHFAAWQPVIADIEVGDYGRFAGGVFCKLGNIREFGIVPEVRRSDSKLDFSFSSAGASVVRSSGGGTVDAFPDAPIDAELEVSFESRHGVLVLARKLSGISLESPDALAFRLRSAEDRHGRTWDLRWRVVRTVYVATNPTIFGANERSTRFSLTGSAAALRKLELGEGRVAVTVQASHASELKLVGEGEGPLALDLFRVRSGGRAALGGLAFAGDGADTEPDAGEVEHDDGWPADCEDDPTD